MLLFAMVIAAAPAAVPLVPAAIARIGGFSPKKVAGKNVCKSQWRRRVEE